MLGTIFTSEDVLAFIRRSGEHRRRLPRQLSVTGRSAITAVSMKKRDRPKASIFKEGGGLVASISRVSYSRPAPGPM